MCGTISVCNLLPIKDGHACPVLSAHGRAHVLVAHAYGGALHCASLRALLAFHCFFLSFSKCLLGLALGMSLWLLQVLASHLAARVCCRTCCLPARVFFLRPADTRT